MTIPALLRKVGIAVPRSVTVNGSIVIDAKMTSAVSAPTSMTTAVAPHRFHGGEDPAPERDDYQSAWWNVDPEAKTLDVEDMRRRFADVLVLDEGGNLAYGVTFDTGRGKFSCLVLPQLDGSLPSVHMVSPKRLGRYEGRQFKRPPHLYTNDSLCVASRADWDGKSYLTSTAVAWAAHWLACYTEWRMSGVWPTEGYGLDVA